MCSLLHGIVVQSRATSLTGSVLYSDQIVYNFYNEALSQRPILNRFAQIPIIGRIAGIMRIALAIIHVIGHLVVALITQDRGHLYHAGKGCCEALRGLIEAIPIVGEIFANLYEGFWMIKMYNPDHPDIVDCFFSHESNAPSADKHYWSSWREGQYFVECDPWAPSVDPVDAQNIKRA